MKVKVGDNVLVLTGASKGKTGKVLKTLKNEQKIVVEGVNIAKRHTKPKTTDDKGGIFDIEMPIHVSNVKVVSEKEVKKTTKKEEVKETKTKEAKKVVKKTTKKASK